MKTYAEGTAVRFWLDADAEPLKGTIISVGRGNGTYRIRSGRRIYTVSFGMVKP